MKKSALLTALPFGVVTETRPDVPPIGTVAPRLVAVAVLICAKVLLKARRLLPVVVSKLVPLIVTAVPAIAIAGVKPVIVGAAEALTVNGVLLVASPNGVLTVIGPVVAPDGTVVTICVGVAELTVAVVPLNLTVFWLAVALNPVP